MYFFKSLSQSGFPWIAAFWHWNRSPACRFNMFEIRFKLGIWIILLFILFGPKHLKYVSSWLAVAKAKVVPDSAVAELRPNCVPNGGNFPLLAFAFAIVVWPHTPPAYGAIAKMKCAVEGSSFVNNLNAFLLRFISRQRSLCENWMRIWIDFKFLKLLPTFLRLLCQGAHMPIPQYQCQFQLPILDSTRLESARLDSTPV